MASNTSNLILCLAFISSLVASKSVALGKTCSYDAIYQFGDSNSDTGNFIRESPAGAASPYARLPYGETYFNKPTGRCSNGLLIIDFFAKALDLPLLSPYLGGRDYSFKHGVNFAVAGSTALDTEFLLQDNIISPATNTSLLVQLNWFRNHLNSICNTETECRDKLKNALFMVGKIGGNDYTYAFFQGKTINEVEILVPYVVSTISHAAKELIKLGAARLVIPGSFPIGCLPIYLTAFQSNATWNSYNEKGCLTDLNEFAVYHNRLLQNAVKQLKAEHPNVVIMYADYYNALLWVLENSSQLGFEEGCDLIACCGTGGKYNFSLRKMCGSEGVSECSNPDAYTNWDGVHQTQNANQYMAEWLLRRIKLKSRCIY